MNNTKKVRNESEYQDELPAYAGVMGLIVATVIAGLSLMAPSAGAVGTNTCVNNPDGTVSCTNSATASVTVASACTMSASLNTPHTDTVSPNQYKAGIGQTTLKVTCNDVGGYAIYAVGYTGEKIGDTNSTKLVGTNGSIVTGTAESGNTSNWAMKLATSGSSYVATLDNGFGSYSAVPSEYTKVAHYSGPTDMGDEAVGSTLTTTYAAFVAGTEAPGTYEGKVKYTMVHPQDGAKPIAPLASTDCAANKICYAPNANNIVGSMDSISTTKIANSATAGVQSTSSNATPALIAPNYSREGYGFAGWSTDYTADENSIIYGPNETITTSTAGTGDADVSTNGLILYPVWVASAGAIQSWNGCSSLTTAPTATRATLSSMTALTDSRDGNVYTVARLADGKCWMTENLRLDAANTLGSTNQSLSRGYGGVFTGLDSSENSNFTGNTNATPTGMYDSTNVTGSYNSYRIPRYNNNNTNRELTASYSGTGSTTYYQWYGYGNYYNWPAAIANTTHNGTNNQSTTDTSLCPTGWRLPQGGDKTRIESNNDNDFWTLIVTNLNGGTNPANYDSQTRPYYTGSTEGTPVSKLVRQFPNNFVYSGYFSTSSANYRGSYGYYWSSTAYNYSSSYNLYLYSSYVYPGTSGGGKGSGRSIRCVAGS